MGEYKHFWQFPTHHQDELTFLKRKILSLIFVMTCSVIIALVFCSKFLISRSLKTQYSAVPEGFIYRSQRQNPSCPPELLSHKKLHFRG